MKKNFIKCGVCGWCMELLWTGFLAFRRREMKLFGRSSIWMFPIYGMAALIAPIYRHLRDKSIWLRGSIYAICIFTVEFITGSYLEKRNLCPWNYSDCKYNYKGLIRLDYAPLWFLAGLFFEKLLTRKGAA